MGEEKPTTEREIIGSQPDLVIWRNLRFVKTDPGDRVEPQRQNIGTPSNLRGLQIMLSPIRKGRDK